MSWCKLTAGSITAGSLMYLRRYFAANYPYYQLQLHYRERIYYEVLQFIKDTQD